jgi:hypothetical protein
MEEARERNDNSLSSSTLGRAISNLGELACIFNGKESVAQNRYVGLVYVITRLYERYGTGNTGFVIPYSYKCMMRHSL